jgi:uncharacterized protein YaaQ
MITYVIWKQALRKAGTADYRTTGGFLEKGNQTGITTHGQSEVHSCILHPCICAHHTILRLNYSRTNEHQKHLCYHATRLDRAKSDNKLNITFHVEVDS